jgi:hypothetical protein
MVHERPVQDVVIERVEGFRESGRLEAVALRFVRDLAPGTVRRDVALTADHTGDFVALHAAGFSWLLYTLDDPGQPAAVLVGLDRVLGAPVLSQDRLRLYRLPAPSVDPLRAAFFLDAHRRRVAELQGSGGLFNADGQIDLERPADAPPPPVANPGPTFIPPPPPLRR